MFGVNSYYKINHTWPEPYKKIDSDEPFEIATVSLVRDMEKPFYEFKEELEKEIKSWSDRVLLGVFPEFCWRKTKPEEVFEYIEIIKANIRPNLALVLGTLEFTLNGKYTNNAIVLYDRKLWFVPKTKILKQDRNLGLEEGINPGVIELPRFNLAVLVCADLWDSILCYKLAYLQKADIFAVPSWTATRKGNRKFAQQDWHALVRTRSTEHSIIVAVADHFKNFPSTDVAHATVCFTQADREKEFPSSDIMNKEIVQINPKDIKSSIVRWEEKGLAQKDIPQDLIEQLGKFTGTV